MNGIETNRVETSRKTTVAIAEVVKVGTQVTEVKTETTTENEVAFATVEEEDNTIPTGERVVVQTGLKGYDTVMFDVTYVNGIETNRVEVSRTTTAPLSEIVKVGMQVTEVKSETNVEKAVAYATVEEFDNTIPTGERVVVQTGVNGFDTVMYDVTYVNGIETNRVEVNRATTAPVSEVVKVGTQIIEIRSESVHDNTLQYGTQEQTDANLYIGERQVIQQGSEGYDVVLYDVTYVNGIEASRTEISRETIAPVEEIVKVGTKQAIAQISGFRIEELSVDASGVYEGYNSKNVVLRMTATSKNANITYAYVNYESANGYSDQLQFVNVGNNVFEATLPFSSYYTHAGLYQIGLIGASDSAGNTWIIFPEGNGSGLNYTSSDLSAADFTIKETSGLASVAGITLESITIENSSVYVGEWSSNKVTMKVKSDGAPISSAFIAFTLPNGWDNRCDFVYVGNDTYEATVTPYPTFLVGAGSYGVEAINIYDKNGNVFVFFPEGFGTGLNYDSGDLSGAYFEAINRPVVTTETIGLPNAIAFDTIYQDDPNLMVGETKVIQSGVYGNETQYYTVTYTDGIETDRVLSYSELISAPLAKIIAVGSKQPLAQIGGFTLKDLSVEADVAYAGDWEDSKIVTMKVSGTAATIQSAHFNYRLPNGGYGQEDFVYVGNDTFETAVPTYFWGEGSYQTDSVFLIDSNGNSWVIMSEGNGAGYNYTSADLSASDFEVLPAIASVGGVTLVSMDLEDNVIYEDDGTSNKLTIKIKDNDAAIATAYIGYTLPNGNNKSFDFVSVGNDVYEATINQPYLGFFPGVGSYTIEHIFIGDSNGDYVIFFPEGNGSGLNYTSGNLSEGNFEVLAKPVRIIETTTENEVAYVIVEIEDNTIPSGERVVVQTGVNGYDTVTHDVTYVNGVETNRVEAERKTTTPVNEIVKVGTQVIEVKSETNIEKEVGYATVEEFDNTIPYGERILIQTGTNGYDTVTYDVTYVNGVETNRVAVNKITTLPIEGIVRIGTQVIEVKIETEIENIVTYDTINQMDNNSPAGYMEVIQEGEDGHDIVTYEVTYTNGIETARIAISHSTLESIDKIIKFGTKITLNKTNEVLIIGETTVLTATVGPNVDILQDVSWKSSNEAVATVDSKGTVKAVGQGIASISVTDGINTVSCVFSVNPFVNLESISFEQPQATIKKGDSVKLNVTITPVEATNQNVVWTISDESVATVDSTGTVTALTAGTATVTATTEDGNKTANCSIIVPVTFNDEALEERVRWLIGKFTGDIYKTDVEGITNLPFGSSGITDISGLESFTGLKILDLSFTNVTDLQPIKGLNSLEELYLTNTSVSDISGLNNLTNLKKIIISGSELHDLSPIASLVNLTELHLYNNFITDVSALSGLVNLQMLNLNNNGVRDISPLQGLTNLKYLAFYNNRITDISALSGMTQLTNLDLTNNPVSDLSALAGKTSLQQLNLMNASVSDISPLVGAVDLDLS